MPGLLIAFFCSALVAVSEGKPPPCPERKLTLSKTQVEILKEAFELLWPQKNRGSLLSSKISVQVLLGLLQVGPDHFSTLYKVQLAYKPSFVIISRIIVLCVFLSEPVRYVFERKHHWQRQQRFAATV